MILPPVDPDATQPVTVPPMYPPPPPKLSQLDRTHIAWTCALLAVLAFLAAAVENCNSCG